MECKTKEFHEIKFGANNSMSAGGKSYKSKSQNRFKIIDLDKMKVGDVIIIKRLK